MAQFDVDIFNRCIEIDLHGYSHRTAVQVAREKLKEAYEHGFRYVRLIHGAAAIKDKRDGGSVKFALRGMLRRGELDEWVDERGSKNHKVNEGWIGFSLRRNPAPLDGEWKELPPDEY